MEEDDPNGGHDDLDLDANGEEEQMVHALMALGVNKQAVTANVIELYSVPRVTQAARCVKAFGIDGG